MIALASFLEVFFELLDESTAPAERATVLFVAASATEGAMATFLRHHTHLAVRGGARAVLRALLAEAPGSPLRQAADELVAHHGDRGIRLVRTATTRAAWTDDGRLMTIETGATLVGDVAFSPDGERVIAFVSGGCSWDEEVSMHSSWLGQWSVVTGELLDALPLGQFRDENGEIALSPSGALLAIRSHRSSHLYAFDPETKRVRPLKVRTLRGREGPYASFFIDDATLIVNDAGDLKAFNLNAGDVSAEVDAIGFYTALLSRRDHCIVVGGSGSWGGAVAIHEVGSLALRGVSLAGDLREGPRFRRTIDALALSPSEEWLASGGDESTVRLWRMSDLLTTSTLEAPNVVRAPAIGRHASSVAALAFVDDARLVSAGEDGVVLEWRVSDPPDSSGPVKERAAHHGYITSLAVDGTRSRAASSASDGRVVLWDLTRGASPRPPFSIKYDGARPVIELKARAGEAHITVGDQRVVFDARGTTLRWERLPPAETGRRPDVTSMKGEPHELTVRPLDFDTDERFETPSLELLRGDELLDSIVLEAPMLAWAWLDARTLVVLDHGGHVSWWGCSTNTASGPAPAPHLARRTRNTRTAS